VVSESGRQPWLVYGKLLVTNSVSSLSTGELIASLAAFWIIYLALFSAWVRQIVRQLRVGPGDLPGQEGIEAVALDAADIPAETNLPMTPAEA
jgi:cytochrome d ubiquinol oxidase subunit I